MLCIRWRTWPDARHTVSVSVSKGNHLITASCVKLSGGLIMYDSIRQNFFITSAKEVMFSSLLSVCLLATLRKNFRTDLHENFSEGWQWASEQMTKFWWRFGSPSGYVDSFPDSTVLGDTEIRKTPSTDCAAQHCSARHALAGITVATMTSYVTGRWRRYAMSQCF